MFWKTAKIKISSIYFCGDLKEEYMYHNLCGKEHKYGEKSAFW